MLINIATNKTVKKPVKSIEEKNPSICPVCGSILNKGERIHSALYPGEEERMVYVYGCPYCYKKQNHPEYNKNKLDPEKIKKRKCPVCSGKLKGSDFLIGKMWDTELKPHLKVLGCLKCRRSLN